MFTVPPISATSYLELIIVGGSGCIPTIHRELLDVDHFESLRQIQTLYGLTNHRFYYRDYITNSLGDEITALTPGVRHSSVVAVINLIPDKFLGCILNRIGRREILPDRTP